MSTSPSKGPKTDITLLPDPQREEPTPRVQRHPSFSVAKKLVILVALAISLVGCITISHATQSDGTDGTVEVTRHSSNDLSAQASQPDPVQNRTDLSSNAEAVPVQNVSASTPFSLEEPTATSEPTATPTRAIIDPPTSTPTVPASPTATSRPTDTPTSTPPASPTLTNLSPATPTPAPSSASEIRHVVIISIDGLRPDALFLAVTPNLDELIAMGAYSPNAQTIKTSETLPSHASMLGGMTEEKHGILWGVPYIGWPGMNGPTLFNVAHDAGLTTGMVFGKEKMNYLVLGNSVDRLFGENVHDPEIKEQALDIIQAGLPDVLFIHFPDVDRVGHAYGWMSENQFQSITFVDGLIGELVTELENGDYLNSTLIIVTADHGGHGFRHGDDSPLDRTIPWLAVGPGVPSGVTLNSEINTYDTAATVLHALSLPIPEKWDGQPILEIFP